MERAPRNRTLEITENDRERLLRRITTVTKDVKIEEIENTVIKGDIFDIIGFLPAKSVDLLFVDPPYNLTKTFNNNTFKKQAINEYTDWLESWISKMVRLLKPDSTIYICGDWRSSASIHLVAEKYFVVQNRITFEREKGRGADSNWKNNSEDIWFCTMSNNYTFNVDKVKLKRKVLAPYRENGKPKDWEENSEGSFRLTYPSNIWNDITIPFWSMPENTPHPTQKPEKLLAKIILASSNPDSMVFDPFAGVGTTGVVAKKLCRRFAMVEIEEEYCLYALKRLEIAEHDNSIQGYRDGLFWERNSLNEKTLIKRNPEENELFTDFFER